MNIYWIGFTAFVCCLGYYGGWLLGLLLDIRRK